MVAREVAVDPVAPPAGLAEAVRGYEWARDTVGESGGAVYRLHAPGRETLYLKHGRGEVAGDVIDETARLRWLEGRSSAPLVRGFAPSLEEAWLLMTAVPGRTAYQWLEAEPDRRGEIVTAIAEHLRAFHSLPVDECPFDSGHRLRLAHARRMMEAGLVDASDFGEEHTGWTPRRVWDEMLGLLPIETDPVVTHGDYSLDNILLEDGRVAGCVDMGRLGVADRYQDLAILRDCLGEFDAGLQARLFDAYGIAEPDPRKLRFHLALDEFF